MSHKDQTSLTAYWYDKLTGEKNLHFPGFLYQQIIYTERLPVTH